MDSRRPPNKSKTPTTRPLSEQERIDNALLRMVTRTGRSMQADRIELWHQDLRGVPIEAIESVFETWGRTERQLPTCADIYRLLRVWAADRAQVGCGCESEHGTGYDINDCLWLFKRAIALSARNPNKHIATDEWIGLFKELNANREGGVPSAFRGAAAGWMVAQ